MFTLNKLISKLKLKNKILLKNHEIAVLMHVNEIDLETSTKHKKYETSVKDKKNILILILDTLININIPLTRSNSFLNKFA